MSNLRKKLTKTSGVSISMGSQGIKAACVGMIIEALGYKLVDMNNMDVVDYLEMSDTLDFENIGNLLEDWINNTLENSPEFLSR